MGVIKHVVNGDQSAGWYCYQCSFFTRDAELAAAHDGLRIRTEHVCPPIPLRQFDWSAIDDNTYDGPGSRIGHGTTEQEAIDNLLEQIADNR